MNGWRSVSTNGSWVLAIWLALGAVLACSSAGQPSGMAVPMTAGSSGAGAPPSGGYGGSVPVPGAAGSGALAGASALAGGAGGGGFGGSAGGSGQGGAAGSANGGTSGLAGASGATAGSAGMGSDGTAIFLAVGYAARRVVSFDGKTWKNEQNEGADGHNDFLLRGSCIGNGLLVAVGGSDKGRIMISRDRGVQWTTTLFDQFFSDCAFGNGIFVAGGGNHPAVYSSDAINWTPIPDVDGLGGRRVFFANGIFLGGGDSGVVLWSSDGIHWKPTKGGLGGGINYFAYGAGRFVGIGDSGRRTTSTDGETWTDGSNGNGLADVTFGKGLFYSSGAALNSSMDGLTWQSLNANQSLGRLAFGAGVFVATAGSGFVWSSDGMSYSPSDLTQGLGGIEEISFGQL